MKKITFIISLFCALITYSQHTLTYMDIIDEQFDSKGCTTSINLEFKENHSSNIISDNPHKYVLFMKNYVSGTRNVTSKTIEFGPTNGNSMTLTSGDILITGTTEMWLMLEYEKKVGTGRRGSKWQPTHIRAEIVKCLNDIDDDGVLNDDDECPSTYGNINNFGCPGTPDLIVDERETRQVSDCYECTSTIYETAFLNDSKPTIYRFGGNLTLNALVIKNIGDGEAIQPLGSVKIRFYLSKDTELSSDDFGFEKRTLNLNRILKAGESTPSRGEPWSLAVSLEGSDIGSDRSYGDYYIIIVIDEQNELGTELNRENNTSVIPVKYTGDLPGTSALLDATLLDFRGQIIIKAKVESKVKALLLFSSSSIKEGMYFLHIYNNGTFIERSKFFKKTGSVGPIRPVEFKRLKFQR